MATAGGLSIEKSTATRIYPMRGYGFQKTEKYGLCLNSSNPEKGMIGGHNHYDKGSFVLNIAGDPIFIDSGTFCYTPHIKIRKRFKQTNAHNTIRIDGHEQASFGDQQTFSVPNPIQPYIVLNELTDKPVWTLTHDGFAYLDGLGLVTREVTCSNNMITIMEQIEGRGEHYIEIFLNLEPGLKCRFVKHQAYIVKDTTTVCSIVGLEAWHGEVHKTEYSPAYGEAFPSSRIVFAKKIFMPVFVSWRIMLSPSTL